MVHAVEENKQETHSSVSTAKQCPLKMRACLAWADKLLKCLATPVAGGSDAEVGAGRGSVPLASGVRESVLLHVVTSFAPGSHSKVDLQPGTIAEAATEKLGSSGECML